RKVKGIIHWVSIQHSVPVEVRLYDRLFVNPSPGTDDPGGNFLNDLNPDSIETVTSCRVEPGLLKAKPEDIYQFERVGYFCVDSKESRPEALVFNRTVTLRDTWAKLGQENSGQN
ncbi:MAG: glutamine--tRNA ligase, partial [SAR324 cluster bacterium]|nr:glutamine--tRNA ligase [SAR324 cluster bacterium]